MSRPGRGLARLLPRCDVRRARRGCRSGEVQDEDGEEGRAQEKATPRSTPLGAVRHTACYALLNHHLRGITAHTDSTGGGRPGHLNTECNVEERLRVRAHECMRPRMRMCSRSYTNRPVRATTSDTTALSLRYTGTRHHPSMSALPTANDRRIHMAAFPPQHVDLCLERLHLPRLQLDQ